MNEQLKSAILKRLSAVDWLSNGILVKEGKRLAPGAVADQVIAEVEGKLHSRNGRETRLTDDLVDYARAIARRSASRRGGMVDLPDRVLDEVAEIILLHRELQDGSADRSISHCTAISDAVAYYRVRLKMLVDSKRSLESPGALSGTASGRQS